MGPANDPALEISLPAHFIREEETIMKRSGTTRREFLRRSAAAAAAAPIIPCFSTSASAFANASSNDRPTIGCIGVGSMGTGDARGHASFGDIVAVCDVDARHAERAKNDERIGKGKADAYGDYRRVLERDDIDVVSVVTPDHWHVKIVIEALQAGKHVFCQKPLTLTLEENQLVRARARSIRISCSLLAHNSGATGGSSFAP